MTNELTSYRVDPETKAIIPFSFVLAADNEAYCFRARVSTTDYTLDSQKNERLNNKVTAICQRTKEEFCLERKSSGWVIAGTHNKVKLYN